MCDYCRNLQQTWHANTARTNHLTPLPTRQHQLTSSFIFPLPPSPSVAGGQQSVSSVHGTGLWITTSVIMSVMKSFVSDLFGCEDCRSVFVESTVQSPRTTLPLMIVLIIIVEYLMIDCLHPVLCNAVPCLAFPSFLPISIVLFFPSLLQNSFLKVFRLMRIQPLQNGSTRFP